MNRLNTIAALMMSSVALITAGPASAEVTFSDITGQYWVGIGPDGEIFDGTSSVGLLNPAGEDYIREGTPRDTWGVAGSTGSAFADSQYYGTSNILNTSVVVGAHSATYTSTLANDLSVTQFYTFYAPNILSIQETITNIGISDVTGIVFRRNVDFDIPLTTFAENTVGVFGSNASVIGNSYDGFQNPDAAVELGFQCGTLCNEIGDLGAGIDLSIGTLAPGGSATFAYYYGMNQPGQNLVQLFGQAQGLGLSYMIGVQSTENGAFPALGARSAFLGVSNLNVVAGPVPEPATWAMMIVGFGVVGASLRRRKPVVAQLA